ncbi:sporulation-delaying protein SdpB family protein [Streptosporangium sp. NPDC002524]|uniref:sporulation-delaying protein SdpB family protein n=1 Tax=Streptosporangium sp. NPDC002524 TaxID=3154537 RepID=UPI0033165E8E
MLIGLLSRLGAAVHSRAASSPRTNVYGLARTLLASATLGTLLTSSSSTLFDPGLASDRCEGVSSLGLFCLVPPAEAELARLAAIVGLLVVASGWRPRVTALPHWWITFGFQTATTVPDGGDQLASIVTLLLLPVALGDRRRWHWTPAPERTAETEFGSSLTAWSALLVIRLQVAGVYFQASVAKLGREEWADGTALYYWLTHPQFAAPSWSDAILHPILTTPLGVAAFTWVPLAIEFAIAMGLFLRRRTWPFLLTAGIALHLGIAVLMGLTSFALVMIACLVLHLRLADNAYTLPPFLLNPRDSLQRRGARLELARGSS